MVDDIIETVIDRFNDFGLYLELVYDDKYGNPVYSVMNAEYDFVENDVIFCDDCLIYYHNGLADDMTVYYAELDIDMLVGSFLCKAIYGK